MIIANNKDFIGGVNLVLTKNGLEIGKYIGNPLYLKKGIAKLATLSLLEFVKDILPNGTEIFARTMAKNVVNI